MLFMTKLGNEVERRASIDLRSLKQGYSETPNTGAKTGPEYYDINLNWSIYISLAPSDDG